MCDQLPGWRRTALLLHHRRAVSILSRRWWLLPAEPARERCDVDAPTRRTLAIGKVTSHPRACCRGLVAIAVCERMSPNGRGRGVTKTSSDPIAAAAAWRMAAGRVGCSAATVQNGVSAMMTFLFSLSATALVAIGAMALAASPARADVEYPWCTVTSLGGGAGTCYYTTLEQCQASLPGGGGYCQPNPRAPAAAPRQRRGAR